MFEMRVTGMMDVQQAIAAYGGKARRACAVALNQTGKAIKQANQDEMRRVFKNPVPFTLKSLQLDTADANTMTARVWFNEPPRMGQHYLVPQVEGGPRHLKGFERGIGLGELVPALGAKRDQRGNVSFGQLRQILSVLGKAETSAGYMANVTARSRKRNTKERDYVIIDGRQRGNLPHGVYQRFRKPGADSPTMQTRRKIVRRRNKLGLPITYDYTDRSKAWQSGKRKGIIRATGLRPVLLQGRTGHNVTPLLDFYGIARKVYDREFERRFWQNLNAYLASS